MPIPEAKGLKWRLKGREKTKKPTTIIPIQNINEAIFNFKFSIFNEFLIFNFSFLISLELELARGLNIINKIVKAVSKK